MAPTQENAENVDNSLQCYNKGCGKKFNPSENNKDACCFHPGPPFFHDAYKIWNCCNKKSTDFGTWLNYPGCTRGKHNEEKPVDIVKVAAVKEIRPEKEEEVIVWKGLNKPAERKTENERIERKMAVESTAGAMAAIEKFRQEAQELGSTGGLRIGAPCRNNGCDKLYEGEKAEVCICQHHPGQAIFHEGMKYWSCCNKKTSNFNAFLDQVGCEKGEHNWSLNEIVSKVREDWFSSNGSITVNVYCRGSLPEEISVDTDGQMLRAKIIHGFGAKETDLVYELWGEIVPEESRVVVGERKVEMILKQKDVAGWPRLKYDPELDGLNSEGKSSDLLA